MIIFSAAHERIPMTKRSPANRGAFCDGRLSPEREGAVADFCFCSSPVLIVKLHPYPFICSLSRADPEYGKIVGAELKGNNIGPDDKGKSAIVADRHLDAVLANEA